MKKLLLCFLLLLPFTLLAQSAKRMDTIQGANNNSSEVISLKENWYYTAEFNPATDSFNTTGLIHLNNLGDKHLIDTLFKAGFKGKGWFLHEFEADSSKLNLPLAFLFDGYGAYKIYLDGKFLRDFGTFGDKRADGEYVNPNLKPTLFSLNRTGKHVLAIQLENKKTIDSTGIVSSYSVATEFLADVKIVDATNAVYNFASSFLINSIVFYGIGVIFLVLSFLHFVLFAFYKKGVSNFYFGLFNFSSGILALRFFTSKVNTMASVNDAAIFASAIFVCVTCFSLHAFINSIHLKRKWGYWVIGILSVAHVVYVYCSPVVFVLSPFNLLLGFTTIDAIVRIIIAMRKKVPGAKILGFGILFFFLSFTAVCVVFYNKNVIINFNEWSGIFFAFMMLCIIFSIPFSISIYLAWEFATLNKHLQKQFQQIDSLSQKTIEQEKEKQLILENQKEHLEQEVQLRTSEVVLQKQQIEEQHTALISEKKKSDELLLNILPAEVAEELKEKGEADARLFEHVSVLFTDFVNFTQLSEKMTPQALVAELHSCFRAFDEIAERNGMEKIKTIGDAYLAVSGMPVYNEQHARNAVKAGLEIAAYIKERKSEHNFKIRVGIHSGPLVAGIVGVKKFAYDIWGDTVNTASRMESSSEPGKVNISERTYHLVKDDFRFVHRGKIDAKHKGAIEMYFVEALI